MDFKFVSLPALAVAATALAGSPAFAERRGGQPHASHHSASRGHHSESRGSAEHAQPRASRSAPAPRGEGRVAPRATAAPRYYGGGVAVPRNSPRYNSSYYGHGNFGYGTRYYYGGRYYATPWHGWYGYAAFHPYYFRPHFSIAFGVYVGYPVPYYAYPYPVPVYGYGAPPAEVNVGPYSPAYGGVSLQIAPNDAVDDAAVYVDGTYAGVVSDFDGTRQPLTLTQGTHHLEIDHNGFRPLTFDVTVQPGMVTPYQGLLQPD